MANPLTLERRNKLAQILVSEGSVKVGKLAEMFNVSTETIRKDLLYLEQEGIARKSHGGAVASNELMELERPFVTKSLENIEIKMKIAQAAMAFIPDNGVVALDAGSTVFSIGKLLALKRGLTVITNSIGIAQILAGTDNSVFLIGGKVRSSSMALVGMWGMEALQSIQVHAAFLGTDGLVLHSGPCTASYEEAEIKKAMLKSATKRILVSDSLKFRNTGLFQFCEWQDLDAVITDVDAPAEEIAKIEKYTQVIQVE